VSNMQWTQLNGFAFRYFEFALVLIPPVCAAAFAEGIAVLMPKVVVPLIAITLAVAALFYNLAPFETPSSFVERSRRDDALALAALAQRHGASFVAGDYYIVWPAVFETIRLRQAAGDPAALQIRGLAAKGEHQREEIAAELRSSDRVVVVFAGSYPEQCVMQAFRNDATDWPPVASVLESGTLPSGAPYRLVVFQRTPPPANEPLLPSQSTILLHMLAPEPGVAKWEGEKISVAANGQGARVFKGPRVNLAAGNYRVSFRFETGAAPAAPLLHFQIMDGFGKRVYTEKDVTVSDLQSRDGGLWLTADFSVPKSNPTQTLEFGVWTFGAASFAITAIELSRQP
jgi:hypothetical protein